MGHKVATNIHRLISDLWHDPAVERDFNNDRQAIFQRYGLSEEEIEVMNNPEIEAMGELGVFPISQVIYLLKAVPEIREHISMRKYIDRIKTEINE